MIERDAVNSFVFFLRQTAVQLLDYLRRYQALTVKFSSMCQCVYNHIDGFELNRKFFQCNALPFPVVVFEEDVGRIRSSPLVVGQDQIRFNDDVRCAIENMQRK